MKKRFSELTDQELLSINDGELFDSIKIEAIERGIAPPIPISEALRKSEYVGYQRPADYVEVWEIHREREYSGLEPSGVAYLSKEAAERAIEGMVSIVRSYGGKVAIKDGDASVTCVKITTTKSSSAFSKLEEFVQSTDEFDALEKECMDKLSAVRQAAYNDKIRKEKKAEYMRLAGGDEETAKRFWARMESSSWDDDAIEAAQPAIPNTIEDDIFG